MPRATKSILQLDELLRRGRRAPICGRNSAGTAYAGRGDFVAYMLGIDGFADQPVYIIYGTPTSDAQGIFTDSNVVIREYALTEDPIGQSPSPILQGRYLWRRQRVL